MVEQKKPEEGILTDCLISEAPSVVDKMREQAISMQDSLLEFYGNIIPSEISERNKNLSERIIVLDDEDVVDSRREWNIEEIEVDDATYMIFVKNTGDSEILDKNTGLIHIFDLSQTVSDDSEVLEDDLSYTRAEADYLMALELAYDICLQYLDRSLSIPFRIAASAYYSEQILQQLVIRTPLDSWNMRFHVTVATPYAQAGREFGSALHRVAFGSLKNDEALSSRIIRFVEENLFVPDEEVKNLMPEKINDH